MPTRILFLGPSDSTIAKWLGERGEHVTSTMDRLTVDWVKQLRVHWIVSYGYRHIVKSDILRMFPRRAVNLHISLLPWNRGADPNLWSFIENTPKGVTIHLMDDGVDTGDIIAQREILLDERRETLATSYAKLQAEIQRLFYETWPRLKSGDVIPYPQPQGGSTHRSRDKEPLLHLLSQGWETRVEELQQAVRESGWRSSIRND